MWYLYLDESGDLGFDFANKKPSRFFTITILSIQGTNENQKLNQMVTKIIRKKLFKRNRKPRELKGSSVDPQIKEYFYKKLMSLNLEIFSISLNKRKAFVKLIKQKPRIYNYMASRLLKKIALEKANTVIELIVDKSKGKTQIQEFNEHLLKELKDKIKPKTRFDIRHMDSNQSNGLQAVDMLCWGLFQKYERKNSQWIELFKEKIKYEALYS